MDKIKLAVAAVLEKIGDLLVAVSEGLGSAADRVYDVVDLIDDGLYYYPADYDEYADDLSCDVCDCDFGWGAEGDPIEDPYTDEAEARYKAGGVA